ncbi:MAG: DCC1-like thiol-disulfide oxidoreductase family protein [Stappiaceae bacterium]
MEIQSEITCVYDGACPLCTYAAVSYQRATLEGDVTLIDSRTQSDHPILDKIKENNINLDHGGVFMKDGKMFGGVIAMEELATTQYRVFSHAGLFLKTFGRGRRAKIVYPILKTIRDIWITLSGAGKINPHWK